MLKVCKGNRDMGLYDDRMDELSESRRSRAAGRPSRRRANPGGRSYPSSPSSSSTSPFAAARKSMEIQSLLFSRDAGWTTAKAKKWAKDHGYKYGKVDVTDQYIRIRQFDPKGHKVKRTITLGRGIRAVVAREEDMAKPARRRTKAKAPRKRSTRRKTKARATTTRRRRSTTASARRRKPAKRKTTRRRRARASTASPTAAAPRRRRRAKAAPAQAPRRRRRRRRASEPVAAAPRRRRRRSAPKRRSRRRTHAAAPRRRSGMGMGEFAVSALSAGIGFVIADGLDRFLATYNPAATEAPKDKFTSDGAGTLANTLNVASAPGLVRAGAAVGAVAVPAIASMYTKGYVKSTFQGLTLGGAISGFRMLWNNVVMPMLKPKDTSAAALQKSYIARLYPAEVAASINRAAQQKAVSSAGGAGALSGAETGVGKADVGPFALQDSPGYPDAAEALRRQAGMAATPGNDYPTVQQTMGTGGDGDFPTATQALNRATGQVGGSIPGQPGVAQNGWEPGPPPLPGPGPQAAPGTDPACGCMADGDQFLGFIGDKPEEERPLYASAAQ